MGGIAPPRLRITQGVGFLSEDRKAEGLALARSIEDNVTLSALAGHARWGWLRLRDRRAEVARWIARLRINATGPTQAVSKLSGGNQQKVALARLLHQQADVLLLDEPTCGVDVGSKAEIYRLIGELAAQGKAILVVSSYLPELLGICDRIAVMSRGALCEARPVALGPNTKSWNSRLAEDSLRFFRCGIIVLVGSSSVPSRGRQLPGEPPWMSASRTIAGTRGALDCATA